MNLFAQAKPVSVFATGSQAVNFIEFEYKGERSDIIDSAFVTITYANGIRANFNLCMFAPMIYEELVLCGDAGRLKAFENRNFLPTQTAQTGLEILRGERQPARISTPCYPTSIEETGHGGATYFEHVNFVDNIAGQETSTATATEGFWSIVVGIAAEESLKSGAPVSIADLLKKNKIKQS